MDHIKIAAATLYKLGERSLEISDYDVAEMEKRFTVEHHGLQGGYSIRLVAKPDAQQPDLPLDEPAVYSHPACAFEYCPYPDTCRGFGDGCVVALGETTGAAVAAKAARLLADPESSDDVKSVAASALTQAADKNPK